MTTDGQLMSGRSVIGTPIEGGETAADSVQAVCERRVDEIDRALRASGARSPA